MASVIAKHENWITLDYIAVVLSAFICNLKRSVFFLIAKRIPPVIMMALHDG